MNAPVIRAIQPEDNPFVAKIIRNVLEDFNVPKVGTAYADASLDCMFETYQKPRSAYFILEENNIIIGGGGIAQLDHYEGNVCELQKMYFLEGARGRGLGTRMIDICLKKAREFGYEQCYLETMSYMEAAQKLYKKYGFQYIDGAMGDTGHHACGVNMLLDL
ncbi:MAG: GNAT family N-acetyltransferase [Flavobacteriaceae bacterium]